MRRASVDLIARRTAMPPSTSPGPAPGLTQGPPRTARCLEMAHTPLHQRTAGAATAWQHAARAAACGTRSSTSAARWWAGHATGQELQVATSQGRFAFDFLILATGFAIDWAQKPEFAPSRPHVRSWGENATSRRARTTASCSTSPDLGPVFELREVPGACRASIASTAFATSGAVARHGVGRYPRHQRWRRRLASGIAGLLYAEDVEQHFAALQTYAEPELLGDEWTPADTRQRVQPESPPT